MADELVAELLLQRASQLDAAEIATNWVRADMHRKNAANLQLAAARLEAAGRLTERWLRGPFNLDNDSDVARRQCAVELEHALTTRAESRKG